MIGYTDTFTYKANDGTADSSITHGMLTLNSNGSFVYTPEANSSGTDMSTYKANDGTVDSNVATVTITANTTYLPRLRDTETKLTSVRA